MSYSLLLPFPPSDNSLHRNASAKVRYKSKSYTKWLDACDTLVLAQKPFTFFNERVDVTIHLNGGTDHYDCDNFLKAPMDYLTRLGIIKDDKKKHVRSAKAIWDEVIPKKSCLVFIDTVSPRPLP